MVPRIALDIEIVEFNITPSACVPVIYPLCLSNTDQAHCSCDEISALVRIAYCIYSGAYSLLYIVSIVLLGQLHGV